ncbi:MAG: hypothetical protein CVT72_07035 [Alphaproteobacteria bacterium HGW-Alphaproteobacteria-11]|nr:MAG: hypothetical protein CVT72_07035 [Alphaproteobacteria bacterium HGW-Alphaproteobacteria-11]
MTRPQAAPRIAALLVFLAATAIGAGTAQALSCETDGRHDAQRFGGEIAGAHHFGFETARGWTFMLEPRPHGWQLRLLDTGGRDLTAATPPLHGETNPRDLYGWHFRSLDNSGPNLGDVNAPQRERNFVIAQSGETDEGYGWLKILDYGLADLEPGARARMVYMRFDICLVVPKTQAEIDAAAWAVDPNFAPEEEERMRACGLPSAYRLEAWLLPRWLEGDFDGDDAIDAVAPVVRSIDGHRAIAVCRAGTWLSIFGGDEIPGLPAGYFDLVEAWRVGPMSAVPLYAGEISRPSHAGDVLTLERIEKSAYSLYWHGGAAHAHRHYP